MPAPGPSTVIVSAEDDATVTGPLVVYSLTIASVTGAVQVTLHDALTATGAARFGPTRQAADGTLHFDFGERGIPFHTGLSVEVDTDANLLSASIRYLPMSV